jgi:hypothetical protein
LKKFPPLLHTFFFVKKWQNFSYRVFHENPRNLPVFRVRLVTHFLGVFFHFFFHFFFTFFVSLFWHFFDNFLTQNFDIFWGGEKKWNFDIFGGVKKMCFLGGSKKWFFCQKFDIFFLGRDRLKTGNFFGDLGGREMRYNRRSLPGTWVPGGPTLKKKF